MTEVMRETMGGMSLTAGIMTVFGVISMLLAGVGVYGVTAYSVAQRRREFGIRMALGARPETVVRMVLWQGFVLAAWGMAWGLAGGIGISRLMSGIMYGVNSGNIVLLSGVPALLGLISLAASWFPARSATRVDPVAALRQQ